MCMMILGREYMVLCYPYLVPASIAPVDTSVRGLCTWIAESIEISVLVLLQVIGVFVKRHMPPRFTMRGDDLFETDLVTHESASPYLCFPLHCLQFHFFFCAATPCFTATDLSAIVRPAEECPFGNCLPASFNSFDVGGFIASFLVTICVPRWLEI